MKTSRYLSIVAILCFLTFYSEGLAQSLEFTKSPTGPVSFDLDVDVAKINLHVKNISTSPVKVWVTMDTSKLSPSHRAYFCWEQCYSFGVVDARNITGGKPITLKPGQDTSAFTAYVDHYAVYNEPRAGLSILGFDFFNEEDPSDRISISLTFNVGNATSVTEQPAPGFQTLYWNTTTQSIIVPKEIEHSLITLTAVNGYQTIVFPQTTLNIAPGIYGYSYANENGLISRGILSIIQ